MRDRLDEFDADVEVVVVTFTEAASAADYRERNDLDLTVLIDVDRSAYRAFGLGRGSVTRVWGWRAARRYVEILRSQGRRGLRRPTEDTLQLGGDFVIGADGRLMFGHWGKGPDDRPDIDLLIAAASPTR